MLLFKGKGLGREGGGRDGWTCLVLSWLDLYLTSVLCSAVQLFLSVILILGG